ncbi:50S ribosomal protein L24 [Coprinopsis cinerea okayama7|uniref:Large ribosomal subunit protein bL28c n=1 Tax=Coprinopsis cinerea (strain Okayama-7 / 130 / ATCC MYA-4618 / FGSC 9003) TaxID=240176 RepID=A8P0U6_COPC7|nr:mitochondrial 54S ribosomal protein domain-containing protein [Coprinopsis cinerea okayama7\|eukprot:XP_001837968.1 mitochondrial 54S ribosomal protein domain-containing protein [Coprinopsis cinerea okayama7\
MFASLIRLGEFSQPFKRAQFGLFGGKSIQYGNNVPFSKHKTRRTWLPNVQRKRLDSEVLGEKVRIKVTTRALRTIKKYGGLDNYLKGTQSHKLSFAGLDLKLKIKDAEAKKLAEFRQSPEGKEELQRQLKARDPWGVKVGAMNIKLKRIASVAPSGTLEGARQARREAAKALGIQGLASPQQTFEYFTQRQQ